MKYNKFSLRILFLSLVVTLGFAAITYAAFADKGEVKGSSFNVGSADLKLYQNVSGTSDPTNLVDELSGPSFSNIGPNWSQSYLIKLYNNSTSTIDLATYSNYLTANDPAELRSVIYVEPQEWNDLNGDGLVDTGETGTIYGQKTITKWKTEGYNIGQLQTGQTKGLILRFFTQTVSDTKQGATGIFDFVFDSAQGQ